VAYSFSALAAGLGLPRMTAMLNAQTVDRLGTVAGEIFLERRAESFSILLVSSFSGNFSDQAAQLRADRRNGSRSSGTSC